MWQNVGIWRHRNENGLDAHFLSYCSFNLPDISAKKCITNDMSAFRKFTLFCFSVYHDWLVAYWSCNDGIVCPFVVFLVIFWRESVMVCSVSCWLTFHSVCLCFFPSTIDCPLQAGLGTNKRIDCRVYVWDRSGRLGKKSRARMIRKRARGRELG